MEAKICVDTLAGVKFPEVIAQLAKEYGTGYFWEDFGNAKAQVEKDAESGRTLIRIQGLWAGKSHNYTETHRAKALKFARHIEQIAKFNSTCDIYYSPFCEHRKDAAYMLKLFKELEKICPSVKLVNSPIKGGQWVDGYINEIHNNDKPAGMPKGKFIFSMDGLHQPDCDITKYLHYLENPNCIAFFVWALQDNCKKSSKDTTLALARKCKPTHDLHLSMIFQLENKKQSVSLKAGTIWKTHSEQHKDIDPRANKGVFVGEVGRKYESVKVGKYNLEDGGLTDDKRNTWRSSFWCYKAGRVVTVIGRYKDPKTKEIITENLGTVDLPYRQNEWKEKTE